MPHSNPTQTQTSLLYLHSMRWLYNKQTEHIPFRLFDYGLLGMTMLVYLFLLNKNGLEIGPDSTVYVRGAMNLAGGEGYTMGRYFINHFPIGLSLIYATMIKLFGVSVFNAALILHILWIGLCGGLFLVLLKRSGIHRAIQPIGVLLFLYSKPFLTMSARIMTELPATLLVLACTVMVVKQKNNSIHRITAFLIGCLLGVGLLIRFAMLGIIMAFMLLMLWQARRNWKTGFINACLVLAPAIFMMLSYSFYVSRVYGAKPVNRVLMWHPISLNNLLSFFSEPLSWLMNINDWQSVINYVLLLVLGLMLVHYVKSIVVKGHSVKTVLLAVWRTIWLRIIMIMGGAYGFFLVVSISLFDAATPIDMRILTPISFLFYWSIALLFNHVYGISSYARFTQMGLWILGILFSATFPWLAKNVYANPQGYSTSFWKNEAPLIIDDTSGVWLKPNRTIYTNALAYWQMHNNKRVFGLPLEQHAALNQNNSKFDLELYQLTQKIIHDSAQVVFFYSIPSDYEEDHSAYIRRHFTDTNRLSLVPMNNGIIIRAKVSRAER